jgi:hypothetical protein
MDFEDLAVDDEFVHDWGSTYTAGDWVLVTPPIPRTDFEPIDVSILTNGLQHPDYPGSTAAYASHISVGEVQPICLTDFGDGQTCIVFEREDGQPFSMESIDISPVPSDGPATVDFQAILEGEEDATVFFSFTTASGSLGLETFSFAGLGFENIVRLEWNQANAQHQFDNITVVAPELILQVDVSDPSAVVLTSTSGFAENELLDVDSGDGILLSGFFTGNTGTLDDPAQSGAINVFDSTAGTARQPLNQFFVGDSVPYTVLDLNIFGTGGGGFDMSFLDTETALTGSLTGDLSVGGITGLPTLGATGNVFVGGLNDFNIIGRWEVVPEPSAALAMVVSLATLGAIARSRRAASRTA